MVRRGSERVDPAVKEPLLAFQFLLEYDYTVERVRKKVCEP